MAGFLPGAQAVVAMEVAQVKKIVDKQEQCLEHHFGELLAL